MLVCPHCQFENPNNHKFCQKCGEPLTERTCPGCGALVPLAAEDCPECGTATGLVWRAILCADAAQPLAPLLTDFTQDDQAKPSTDRYLDSQQRYRLLASLTPGTATELETQVLDCKPFQLSFLELAYQQLAVDRTADSAAGTATAAAIPAMALPYLELHEQFPSLSLPEIHDAWQQSGLTVLLLSDRTHLPLLKDLWGQEDILPLQILHWLHEMVELWGALQSYGCCRSLLELPNLHVDEDYLLCLQRLYFDAAEPPLLRDLGSLWQTLFQQSQRTQNSELTQLCLDLELGKITEVEQLQARIEAIATALQPHPAAMSDSDLTEPLEPPTQRFVTSHQPMNPDVEVTGDLTGGNLERSPFDASLLDEEEDDGAATVVLPMRLIGLEDAGCTDIGRQREHNEDCFSIRTEMRKVEGPQGRTLDAKGLYILCDGMGGHASGEVASALAVETLQNFFAERWRGSLPDEACIREAIHKTNRVIYDLNQQNASSGSGRMGTTLVLVLIQGTQAAVAHVGDSRLYRFSRRQGLEQLTTDHEVGQREIQRGVEPSIAYGRPDAYQLTQALGPRDDNFVNPDVQFLELNEDLLLLLCSDGLTDNDLLEKNWQTHLEPILNYQMGLEQGVSQLIELANQQNGHDNITTIAVRARVRPNLDQFNVSSKPM